MASREIREIRRIHENSTPHTTELPSPSPVEELQKQLDRFIQLKLTQNQMRQRIIESWPTEVVIDEGKTKRKSEQLDFIDETEHLLLELRLLFVYTSFEGENTA